MVDRAVAGRAVVERVAVLACGYLLGVFLAAPALVLLPVKVLLEAQRREWCGFPPVALAELRLRVRHPRRAHPREVPARQAKAEVPEARGSLPAALLFLPAA